MYSILHCIDRGGWEGTRVRSVDESNSSSYKPLYYIGDFGNHYGDPHCVNNRISYKDMNDLYETKMAIFMITQMFFRLWLTQRRENLQKLDT